MKVFIRLFFKTLRIVLGPVMLLKEAITRPKGLIRPQAAQDITLEDLLAKAGEKTDLQAAQEMQKAKAELFELFNKPKLKQQA